MQPKKISVMRLGKQVAALFVALVCSTQIFAKDLVIALRTEPTSMDPHFHSLTSNIQINQTIFNALLFRDAEMNVSLVMKFMPCTTVPVWSLGKWLLQKERALHHPIRLQSVSKARAGTQRLLIKPNHHCR